MCGKFGKEKGYKVLSRRLKKLGGRHEVSTQLKGQAVLRSDGARGAKGFFFPQREHTTTLLPVASGGLVRPGFPHCEHVGVRTGPGPGSGITLAIDRSSFVK